MKATTVIKLKIEEASAKIRTGDPEDDKEDLDLDIWSGVLPMVSTLGALIADPMNNEGLKVPDSVNRLY